MYVKVSDLEEYCNTNSAYLQGKGQSVAQSALRRVKEFAIENAVDVQQVKHTENLSIFAFSDEFICKNCGIHLAEWVKLDVEDYEEYEFKFCPNCGARIDLKGGDKNENAKT